MRRNTFSESDGSPSNLYLVHLTSSKFSWFGAVRNEAHLHGVNPLNRLMDENGELTPL